MIGRITTANPVQAIQDQKQAMIEDLEEKLHMLMQENAALKLDTEQAKVASEKATMEHQSEARAQLGRDRRYTWIMFPQLQQLFV